MTSKPTSNTGLIAIVIVLVIALFAQGRQSEQGKPTTIEVKLPDGFGKIGELQSLEQAPAANSTVTITNTTELPNATSSPEPAEPATIRNEQKPKYIPGYDFTVDMVVSTAPIQSFPLWTGNGIPFVNLYYRNLDGTAFNDTGMLHFADMYMESQTGRVGACTNKHFEFAYGRWTSTSPLPLDLTNRSLVYWSNPLPDDWFNLFQDGKNCYWDVTVESRWYVRTCAEGDGELTKHSRETKPDGTIVDHVDFVDYCFITRITVSPVP